ncbi:hypothetical protein V6N11_065256 [Hibiscus sabdariffa]|uniref:Uncharacterized protein n=2 Tax=Hibiscus sabdariffa TaxID=183260 RepID=A0ABR2QGN8_9ROSI
MRLGLLESTNSLGRSSCSWPKDEEDEREHLNEDIKTDFKSELFNNGRLNEDSKEETPESHEIHGRSEKLKGGFCWVKNEGRFQRKKKEN